MKNGSRSTYDRILFGLNGNGGSAAGGAAMATGVKGRGYARSLRFFEKDNILNKQE